MNGGQNKASPVPVCKIEHTNRAIEKDTSEKKELKKIKKSAGNLKNRVYVFASYADANWKRHKVLLCCF